MVKQPLSYFLIISLFFLSGCKQISIKKNSVADNILGELEARHYDIPLLIDAKPISEWYSNHDFNPETEVIAYRSCGDYQKIIDFYQSEMERYGWEQLFAVEQQETIAAFQKPNKHALISIRPKNSFVDVYIFVGAKEYC